MLRVSCHWMGQITYRSQNYQWLLSSQLSRQLIRSLLVKQVTLIHQNCYKSGAFSRRTEVWNSTFLHVTQSECVTVWAGKHVHAFDRYDIFLSWKWVSWRFLYNKQDLVRFRFMQGVYLSVKCEGLFVSGVHACSSAYNMFFQHHSPAPWTCWLGYCPSWTSSLRPDNFKRSSEVSKLVLSKKQNKGKSN